MVKIKKRTWTWTLAAVFILLIAAGIVVGELKMLHTLGSFVCFECIGLG